MYSPKPAVHHFAAGRPALSTTLISIVAALSAGIAVQSYRAHLLSERFLQQDALLSQKDTLLKQKDLLIGSLQQNLNNAQTDIQQLSAELREPKIAEKRVLIAKLESAKREMVQRERRAFSEGQLKILESVRVRGYPSNRDRWFGLVTDHYYTYRVEISGHVFFESMQQETEKGYDAIDTIKSGVELATFLIPPKG